MSFAEPVYQISRSPNCAILRTKTYKYGIFKPKDLSYDRANSHLEAFGLLLGGAIIVSKVVPFLLQWVHLGCENFRFAINGLLFWSLCLA